MCLAIKAVPWPQWGAKAESAQSAATHCAEYLVGDDVAHFHLSAGICRLDL
jgi:hypothetical protein